jgi:hypothetical protein
MKDFAKILDFWSVLCFAHNVNCKGVGGVEAAKTSVPFICGWSYVHTAFLCLPWREVGHEPSSIQLSWFFNVLLNVEFLLDIQESCLLEF